MNIILLYLGGEIYLDKINNKEILHNIQYNTRSLDIYHPYYRNIGNILDFDIKVCESDNNFLLLDPYRGFMNISINKLADIYNLLNIKDMDRGFLNLYILSIDNIDLFYIFHEFKMTEDWSVYDSSQNIPMYANILNGLCLFTGLNIFPLTKCLIELLKDSLVLNYRIGNSINYKLDMYTFFKKYCEEYV